MAAYSASLGRSSMFAGGMSCRASRARMARGSVGSAAVIHASAASR
jgi:hypothetical protein